MLKLNRFILIYFFGACYGLIACGPSAPAAVKPKKDSTVFFPVTDYIKQQVKLVDSTPYFVYLLRIKNGIKDSMPVSRPKFDSLASIFLKYNISDSSIKDNYKENIFQDLTTNSYTITYTSTDYSLPLQSIQVLLNANTQKVKRIFINILENKGDSLFTEKLGWKADQSFFINRIIQPGNGKEYIEQNNIVWNDND